MIQYDVVRFCWELGHLFRTAGYHEVCAADEDGNDGGGGGEDWEQRGVLPERVD